MKASSNSLIAVNDPFTILKTHGNDVVVDFAVLKREALMFDTICIPTLKESFFESNYLYENQRHVLDELEWLLDRRIVQEVPRRPEGSDTLADDAEKFISALIRSSFDKNESQLQLMRPIERTFRAFGELDARLHAVKLREEGLEEVYPVVGLGLRSQERELKSDVVDVVINHFPTPHEDTPWELISEFRSEADSRRKFLALKTWMNDLAKTKQERHEVETKLQSLIAEYLTHMQTHKIETRLSLLKTSVLSEVGLFTAGWLTGHAALAGIVGAVASPLFAVKMYQIGLLKEERKAPGKEIAYIVIAHEEFTQK